MVAGLKGATQTIDPVRTFELVRLREPYLMPTPSTELAYQMGLFWFLPGREILFFPEPHSALVC